MSVVRAGGRTWSSPNHRVVNLIDATICPSRDPSVVWRKRRAIATALMESDDSQVCSHVCDNALQDSELCYNSDYNVQTGSRMNCNQYVRQAAALEEVSSTRARQS